MPNHLLSTASLREFIAHKCGLDPSALDGPTPLFSTGLLDSFNLIDLVTHIEAAAGIKITPGEISLENLDSIERVQAFVSRKISARP